MQDDLRNAFQAWGLPECFRVDNGAPWGSKGDWPTDLALWLIGLGVRMHWNDPGRPQQNGVVERSQGTGKRWTEPRQCRSAEELQERLREMDWIQREKYPSLAGRSRAATYPELAHSGQRYSRHWEKSHWSMDTVTQYLSGYAVARRVCKRGVLSLYNRSLYVGIVNHGKQVHVMFDPETIEWVVADEAGRQLSRKPANEISPERILSLTVTNRRPTSK